MKQYTTLLLLFFFINFNYAQQRGINLTSKKGRGQTYLVENRRIKIKMLNGQKIAGNFKIVDAETIVIKGTNIKIDSILKIRKASTFSEIVSPISITSGSTLTLLGVYVLTSGGYLASVGIIPIVYGSVFIIVPVIGKKHKSDRWNYKIEN